MLKIVCDDKIPFIKGALEPYAEIVYLPGAKTGRAELKDADAVITRTRTRCDASTLDGTAVKFIATATIGYDHIDTEYCAGKGIFWTNAPGCNSSSVAQYICSLLLRVAIKRRISLKGMTLGVVGAGNVGSKVAKVGRALGMRVLLNDPPRAKVEGSEGFASLEEVQAEADFISVHVPLTLDGPDKTFQLAAPAFFGKLAKKPFFINSSRGEVVSGDALKEAIRRGQVSGAALDVWENEPDIDLELLRLLDFATPHIAGYSTDGKANGTAMSVNALAGYFKLPMYEFFPMNVPEPPRATIELAPAASFEKTLFDAVSVSYDIAEDDARLRAKPSDFERLRGDYPLRREFPAYAVSPRGDLGREPLEALAKLGFKIV